jgi:hypothetical protein
MSHAPDSAFSARPDREAARSVHSCRPLFAGRQDQVDAELVAQLSMLVPTGYPLLADGGAPVVELLRSILDVAAPGADPVSAELRWELIGARAQRAGVGDEGFGPVGHALVRTVREVAGDAWSSGLSSAWMAYYVWMAGHLTAGAATAWPAEPEPDAQPEVDAQPDVRADAQPDVRADAEPEPARAQSRADPARDDEIGDLVAALESGWFGRR